MTWPIHHLYVNKICLLLKIDNHWKLVFFLDKFCPFPNQKIGEISGFFKKVYIQLPSFSSFL
jgi:hypothetical protein